MPKKPELISVKKNGDLLITMDNNIQRGWTSEVQKQISKLLEEKTHNKVVLDLTKMNYVTSNTISLFIRLNNQCKKEKLSFSLINVSTVIRERLELVHLERVLPLYKNEDDQT